MRSWLARTLRKMSDSLDDGPQVAQARQSDDQYAEAAAIVTSEPSSSQAELEIPAAEAEADLLGSGVGTDLRPQAADVERDAESEAGVFAAEAADMAVLEIGTEEPAQPGEPILSEEAPQPAAEEEKISVAAEPAQRSVSVRPIAPRPIFYATPIPMSADVAKMMLPPQIATGAVFRSNPQTGAAPRVPPPPTPRFGADGVFRATGPAQAASALHQWPSQRPVTINTYP